MANLFSKSALQQAISATHGHDLSEEIAIVNELYKDYLSGNTNDETRYEQRFNNLMFGQLLGYEENIHRHPKASTPVGSKIADVGLGFFEEGGKYTFEGVKVVVELKGSGTLLDKKQASYGGQSPVDQGFGYKTSFKDCPRLLVSNFASIRLYRDNKQDFEVWTLEQLVDPSNEYYHLRTLLGLLRRSRLISQSGKSYTETLLSEVRIKQEQITKDFYKQYKTLRFELINDIRYLNPETHVETVVEKAQKIIDRIIFIHFCEDRGLLPENKLRVNVEKAREAGFSPWELLKRFFLFIDKGSPDKTIPGYNGGLFHDDPILNSLEVGDIICHKFIALANYDFQDELSVNILGHIFEQSISDIEQLKGELLGEEITTDELVEKKESKRKKDGIFYTPEYIVDYIVQNSLMVYLEEKENECLAKYKKDEIKAYQAYQHILQNIKVLDPACGSGAFLVKVFDYLYKENEKIGDILKQYGAIFSVDEVYKSILRNNIYGVDLNPESVEITKLSLWLKSAQKGKKLNNLDDNIKCGNSLIDDPAVAGERAFDWKAEFSDIMSSGGFDVIVGNPPYVNTKHIAPKDRIYFWEKYNNILENDFDLYQLFIYMSLEKILKLNGLLGFITPNSYFSGQSYSKLRNYLLGKFSIDIIVDFPYRFFPFQEVNTETSIIIIRNFLRKNNITKVILYDKNMNNLPIDIHRKSQLNILKPSSQILLYVSPIVKNILENTKSINFNDFFVVSNPSSLDRKERAPITRKRAYNKCIFTENEIYEDNELKTISLPAIEGNNILRYKLHGEKKYTNTLWSYKGIERKLNEKTWNKMKENKLVGQRITGQAKYRIVFTYDDRGLITMPSVNIINSINNEINVFSLLGIINSSLYNKMYKDIFGESNTNITSIVFETLPIPIDIKKDTSINILVEKILIYNKELHDKTDSFLRYISSKFGLEKLSTKLQKFHDYDFATFLKELKFKKLSMTEEAELMEFFETKKSEIVSLKSKIDATDKEIDEMVFELYGLSEEERAVVLDS